MRLENKVGDYLNTGERTPSFCARNNEAISGTTARIPLTNFLASWDLRKTIKGVLMLSESSLERWIDSEREKLK